MNRLKISVIIPVYNGEKFLRRAIDSVVNQTYTGEYEILLLDDGSTDGTATICKEYAKKYPFVHYHYQFNMGISKTRERAVELARGDYLCWVDADDYVSPDLLKVTLEKLEPIGADICVFSWQARWRDGKLINHIREKSSLKEWRKNVISGGICTVWSYICRRELWENERAPWQVAKCGEDIIKTINIFSKARSIVSVKSILYYYMADNPASITHR